MQVLSDTQTHIEAHQVGQAQRTHRMVIAEFHRSVDVARAGDALLDHAHSFQAECYSKTTGGESGNVAHDDRLFLQALRDLANHRGRLFASLCADHDFHQLHEMHRIEKVHSDHLL